MRFHIQKRKYTREREGDFTEFLPLFSEEKTPRSTCGPGAITVLDVAVDGEDSGKPSTPTAPD